MDLRAGLQRGFGDTYRIERELGGGGMSRVFVAMDPALDRRIVIKVLAPELMLGVSAERFKREIALSAQLQHPHIVSVLHAGETTDPVGAWCVPYYTMPFVDGDSLRARILRGGPLAVDETISILRDVARALVYAHQRGVVHRDIKPDNVLLTGDSAVVTDFGVAKAIADARSNPKALTDAGGVIGTPAYMSAEQATGSAATDHRADIYAFGVTAYEMLTGRLPFAGDTPEQLHASRMKHARDITELRPETPPLLAELVMRCLEPDPDARPQSATHVVRVLESVTSGTGKQIAAAMLLRRTRRTSTIAAIAVAAAVAIGGLAFALRALGVWPGSSLFATGALQRHERILVGDFRGSNISDTALASVVTEAFRISLAQSRNIAVMPPTGMRDALRRMERDVNTRVEGGIAREMATREGLNAFVDGEILAIGGRYVISARLVETSSGEPLVTLQEQAEDERGLLPAVDRLTRGLRKRAGDSFAQLRDALPVEQVTTSSLDAFRAYVQGVRAFNYDDDFDRGRRLLERAISLDTAFAMAYRKLAIELGNRSREPDLGARYVAKAYQHRDRLAELERHLVTGTYFQYGPEADNDKAIEAYEAAVEIQPANTVALNNASTQLRRAHRFREAQRYIDRVMRLPDVGIQSFSGYANNALFLRDTALARRVIDDMQRRFGRPAVAVEKRAAVLYVLGDVDSALAEAHHLADMPVDGLHRSSGMRIAAGILGARGRVREASKALERAATLRALADSVPLMPAIDSAWVSIALRGDTARGVQILDRALAGHPVASISHLSRLYTALGRLLADAGRVDELEQLAALFERDVREARSIYDEGVRQGLAGDIAFARHRYTDAARAYRQAAMAASDCFMCLWPLEAHAYDRAGMPDSAIAVFTRYVEQPDAWRSGDPYQHRNIVDATWLAHAYVRLGELWEQKGDRVRAGRYYAAFVDLWKDADPELQPRVAAARRKLALLRDTR